MTNLREEMYLAHLNKHGHYAVLVDGWAHCTRCSIRWWVAKRLEIIDGGPRDPRVDSDDPWEVRSCAADLVRSR